VRDGWAVRNEDIATFFLVDSSYTASKGKNKKKKKV